MGEPESPTRDEAADYGANEMDRVDKDKPTQSDYISIDYSPYLTEDSEERAATSPVLPGRSNQ